MAMVINSNIMSLNAQNQLTKSSNELNTSMERLTSGKRINSAADDAAGLAIASRMTSQVRGLDQAVRNANDGISLIQTAEGALEESTNILQRMRELSIQSANGTYSEGNRSTLNAEVKQLTAELNRISETTSFNGQKILDGSLGKTSLQVGSEANETISFQIQAMDAKTLGMGSTSVDMLSAETTLADLTGAADLGYNDVLINGQSIVALGDTAIDGTDADGAQQVIDAINNNVSGVSASMMAVATATDVGDGVFDGTANSLTIDVTKIDGTTTSLEITDTESLKEVVDKINSQGQGLVTANLNDDGEISITAMDASAITFTDGAAGTGLGTIANASGQLVLTSDNGEEITVERGSTGTLEQLNALGFRESNKPGVVEGVGIATPTNAWGVGDVTINGVQISADNTDSLQGKINAINDVSTETGVTASTFAAATLDFSAVDVSSLTGGAFNLNGTEITTAAGTLDDVATAINGQTDSTGITAQVLGTKLVLEGNVSSITFADGGGAVADALGDGTNVAVLQSSLDESTGTAGAAAADGDVVNGGIQLKSDNGSPISIELGANATAADIGLLESNSAGDGKFGAAVNSIDISTVAGAQKAISIIDNALDTINSTRGDLGAVSNRLDFTINNLSSISENVSAARSRVEDADFAKESANLSRAQVLQQAGTAMLAQANAAPQQVLSLLQ
ncbi:flagellin [Marinobacterium sp. MBR-109]|jgi:flagellin|uniref:flagellin N-terminal helical domain-containing protein n=1 Tax=Marinobacterium sp. MBR-109 TaxID=3156462 RepID=UPI003396DEDF